MPGVATGLAVTGAGGDVLFVEATAMKRSGRGSGGLVLTGQLGDVMKESAQIALSYVRGHSEPLGIDEHIFEDHEFHVHVPAGAIPKDGPSAGVTMVTALASLLTGRPVKHTVGMTGEVTLQGRVLPIGGVKQKVLAAHAAGLTDVIVPERNRGDLDEIPKEVASQMSFHPVMSIQEVLDRALEPVPSVTRAPEKAKVTKMASRSSRRCAPVPTGGPRDGGPPRAALAALDHLRGFERRIALQRVRGGDLRHLAADALRAAARPGGGGADRAHRVARRARPRWSTA